jgi:hypothetical protein
MDFPQQDDVSSIEYGEVHLAKMMKEARGRWNRRSGFGNCPTNKWFYWVWKTGWFNNFIMFMLKEESAFMPKEKP